jgi:hypothetical protein
MRRSSNALRQPLLGYKINGEAIGGACGKHGTEENCKRRVKLGRVNINKMEAWGMDLSGLGGRRGSGPCKKGN